VIVAVLYLAIGCSAAGFLAYTFGLSHLRASHSVTILNTVPVFGIIFAFVIAGEPFSWILVAGAVVVVAGVLMASLPATRPPKTEQPAQSAG